MLLFIYRILLCLESGLVPCTHQTKMLSKLCLVLVTFIVSVDLYNTKLPSYSETEVSNMRSSIFIAPLERLLLRVFLFYFIFINIYLPYNFELYPRISGSILKVIASSTNLGFKKKTTLNLCVVTLKHIKYIALEILDHCFRYGLVYIYTFLSSVSNK